MSNQPSNSSDSGFYSPDKLPFDFSSNYQEMVNRTDGILSTSILDGIDNLINMMPNYYGEQLAIAGEPVLYLRRKTHGIPCPNIQYETTAEQCSLSKCPICFGTIWTGGYDNPIKLKMSFNPQKVDINFEQAGLVMQETPTAWTIDTDPIMKEMDMVVTYNNIRYLIATAEAEEKRGKRMYQRLTLTRLNSYDVAYAVPVPSVYGDYYQDFAASITINGKHADFPATILIYNEIWYPVSGQNDSFAGPSDD